MKKNRPKIEDARVEPGRFARQGFPEAVYAPGKSDEQVIRAARTLMRAGGPVLITRLPQKRALMVMQHLKGVYYPTAALAVLQPVKERKGEYICVVTAGTADGMVAEEAAITASSLGCRVVRLYDVGVAHIKRVLSHKKTLYGAAAVVVCAGMEGALASVVGGLVRCPVIAVPTSVGYGASYHGVSALLTMINACAPNISVVNIDDGFGAGVIAHLICSHGGKK